ncbi:hypothetical protein CERSUDRAFT_95492 [Gelatoporia subvermispora B]|uniref:Uncharacterized protein n=1 Tax=Ceriporiopsis subvermispora (strain B) TaxID=914234 RepID=M2REH3_CERS8|nr:hypothetical protein CERSUDRAFT_95492 [Gelatoporia subvermispora B]
MSSTLLDAAAATATVLVPSPATESVVKADPPIVEIARLLYSSSGYAFSFAGRLLSAAGQFFLSLAQLLVAPLAFILSVLLYLLAPVIVFFQILLDAVIFIPYTIAVAALQNLYPIYVFVGASLLFSAVIALGARALVSGIRSVLFPQWDASNPAKSRSMKRVSIKEEK